MAEKLERFFLRLATLAVIGLALRFAWVASEFSKG